MSTESTKDRWFKRKWSRLAAAALLGTMIGLFIVSLVLSNVYVQTITQVDCSTWGMMPDAVGLADYQDVSFTSADGLSISGWFIPGNNQTTIVLLEGIGARGGHLPEGAMLADHGYGLMLFDWRGCGTSDPALHTLGYRETEDLLAAVDYLHAHTDTQAIGVLGFSQGGAVAIRAAAVEPRIQAVVAMGGYHDLEAEIFGAGDEDPFVSSILETEIAWLFQRTTGIDFDTDPEPIELIGQISPRPLLLIYGEQEEALPPDSGHQLYQAAQEPKELWLLPNVGHGGYYAAVPKEFEQRVTTFFNSALLHVH